MATDFAERLAGAKAGDEACFVDLFRSVQPSLLRYLSTLGGPLADDVAAETWVSVLKGLPRFKGDEAGWRSWVFTIAHARMRDAQRKAVRTPVPADTTRLLETRPGRADVALDVEEMFSTEAALALVGWLPKDQSEIILLRYVAGLDVAATAKVVGKRPGAVRVAAHRGLKRLAELLGPAPASVTDGAVTQSRRGSVTE